MMTHTFTVKLFGPRLNFMAMPNTAALDEAFDTLVNDLYNAGCDDGLVYIEGSDVYIDFDRECGDRMVAIASARKNIQRVSGLDAEYIRREEPNLAERALEDLHAAEDEKCVEMLEEAAKPKSYQLGQG